LKNVIYSSCSSPLKLVTTTEIETKDCSKKAVEDFVRCLYTGKIEDSHNALERFRLACLFRVHKHRKVYQQIILKNLNEQNANRHKSETMIERSFAKLKATTPDSPQLTPRNANLIKLRRSSTLLSDAKQQSKKLIRKIQRNRNVTL
jgi:BTB/POZ domain